MNIRADKWVRENVHGLGITPKAALRDVISHMRQNEGTVAVSVAAVAADLDAGWETARGALRECVKAGYLAVEKSGNSHGPTVWRVLPSEIPTSEIPRSLTSDTQDSARGNSGGPRIKDREELKAPPPASPNGRARPPVEKRGAPNRLNGEPVRLAATLADFPAAREALAKVASAEPKKGRR